MRRREYNWRKWELHLKLRTSNLTLYTYRSLLYRSLMGTANQNYNRFTHRKSNPNTTLKIVIQPPEKRTEERKINKNKSKTIPKTAVRCERGTSLVVQGLRIHLPMQGMGVWSLIRELRAHRATKPMHHNQREALVWQWRCHVPRRRPDVAKNT